MSLVSIHDKLKKFFYKKQKINTLKLPHINTPSFVDAKQKASHIKVSPGWAVYFVRNEDYVDHIAIVINQDKGILNLAEAVLLHAAPSPIGHGVGPLTNDEFDRSGLRICTAIEFIELHQENYFKKIFVGPPPVMDESLLYKAGLIAENIAKTGLIDDKPVVYTFGFIPLIKKYFVTFSDPKKLKTKIASIKKLKQAVVPLYCGGLVSEIWKRAGIIDIPEVKFLKYHAPTSFTLFKWAKSNNSILGGLSWDNDWD